MVLLLPLFEFVYDKKKTHEANHPCNRSVHVLCARLVFCANVIAKAIVTFIDVLMTIERITRNLRNGGLWGKLDF